jgi:ankyrin repeat protein
LTTTELDRYGRSPLHYAAVENDAGKVAALLGKGADPNLGDALGHTPLHHAAMQNAVDAARALLDGGASPAARDAQGETPLDAAARAPGARDEILALLGGSVP